MPKVAWDPESASGLGELARRVRRVTLLPRPLTADHGELTATLLKVRRQTLEAKYQVEIDRMYAAEERGAAAAPEREREGQRHRPVQVVCTD